MEPRSISDVSCSDMQRSPFQWDRWFCISHAKSRWTKCLFWLWKVHSLQLSAESRFSLGLASIFPSLILALFDSEGLWRSHASWQVVIRIKNVSTTSENLASSIRWTCKRVKIWSSVKRCETHLAFTRPTCLEPLEWFRLLYRACFCFSYVRQAHQCLTRLLRVDSLTKKKFYEYALPTKECTGCSNIISSSKAPSNEDLISQIISFVKMPISLMSCASIVTPISSAKPIKVTPPGSCNLKISSHIVIHGRGPKTDPCGIHRLSDVPQVHHRETLWRCAPGI